MLDMAQTGMETETQQSHSCKVHAHSETHQPGGARYSLEACFVLSAYTMTVGHMLI